LIRIVRVAPDTFELDVAQVKGGRGAYLCPDRACLEKALRRRGLHRSFRQALAGQALAGQAVPEAFYRDLSQMLAMVLQPNKIDTFLALARKAGRLALGSTAAEVALKRRKAKLVIIACDASENTRERFAHLAEAQGVPFILHGRRTQMGHLLGRGELSVVAILDKKFAEPILAYHLQSEEAPS